jgi:hypothetical protein
VGTARVAPASPPYFTQQPLYPSQPQFPSQQFPSQQFSAQQPALPPPRWPPRELPAAPARPALESGPAGGGPAARPAKGVGRVFGAKRAVARAQVDQSAARTRCQQASQVAAAAAEAAARATAEAMDAYDRYATAQRLREEAQLARDTANREAGVAERAAAAAERHRSEDEQRMEKETTHAAFAAFRRGDISADELREVFRRAEGWSPERENMIRSATRLRTAEAEAQRELDLAGTAERVAAERARVAAVSARALEEEARAAAEAARAACAGLPPADPRPASAPPRTGTLRPPVPGAPDDWSR